MRDVTLQVIRSLMIAGLFGAPVFNIFKDVHVGLASFVACVVAVLMSQTNLFGGDGKQTKTDFHKNEQENDRSSSQSETIFNQTSVLDGVSSPSQVKETNVVLIHQKEVLHSQEALLSSSPKEKN